MSAVMSISHKYLYVFFFVHVATFSFLSHRFLSFVILWFIGIFLKSNLMPTFVSQLFGSPSDVCLQFQDALLLQNLFRYSITTYTLPSFRYNSLSFPLNFRSGNWKTLFGHTEFICAFLTSIVQLFSEISLQECSARMFYWQICILITSTFIHILLR